MITLTFPDSSKKEFKKGCDLKEGAEQLMKAIAEHHPKELRGKYG